MNQKQTQVDTDLGQVKIVPINEQIPEGWRPLQFSEGKKIKSKLISILNQLSMVGFKQGMLQGLGHGYQFVDKRAQQCKEMFIIKA